MRVAVDASQLTQDVALYGVTRVPDGQGGFQIINGQGTTNGTFHIPQVPAGPYYLLFIAPYNGLTYPAFYYTSSHAPDMAIDGGGAALHER